MNRRILVFAEKISLVPDLRSPARTCARSAPKFGQGEAGPHPPRPLSCDYAGRVTSATNPLPRASDLTDRTDLLALSGVRVWTPEGTVLLDGIDWQVRPGEHWALLGPNGAGKSTLLRIAGGLRHPSAGTVDVLGRRLGRVDVRTLWPLIGFVNPSLRPPPLDLAVEDVVLTGATGTIQPLWESYGPPERRRV
ncbi:MAG: transporter ATP-binding protein, partial [Actinobacteria bacterium]|nr:transporter ATP-binding protein [Actinomycetota bacterium]